MASKKAGQKRKYTRRTHVEPANEVGNVIMQDIEEQPLYFKLNIKHGGIQFHVGDSADHLSSGLKERFKKEGAL